MSDMVLPPKLPIVAPAGDRSVDVSSLKPVQNVVTGPAAKDVFSQATQPTGTAGTPPKEADSARPDPDSPFFATGLKGGDFLSMDPEIAQHQLDLATKEIDAVNAGTIKMGPKLKPFGGAAVFNQDSVTTDPTLANHSVNSGRARNIVEDPANPGTFFIAGSNSGIEKTEGGKSYQFLTDNAPALSTGRMDIDPNNPKTMYWGLGDPFSTAMPGFLKSVDRGKTWSKPIVLRGTYPGDPKAVTASATRDLKVSPYDPNTVMVATNVGLFRSTDAGKSLNLVTIPSDQPAVPGQPPPSAHKSFWSLDSTGPNSWVAATRDYDRRTPDGYTIGSIWHSEDNGATWSRAVLPKLSDDPGRMTLQTVKGTIGTGNTVVHAVIGAPDGGSTVDFITSKDGGKTWAAPGALNSSNQPENPTQDQPNLDLFHGQAFYNQSLIVDPRNPNNIILGGNLAAVSSNDGGQTWRVESDWAPQYSGMAPRTYAHADHHGGLITYDKQGKMKVIMLTDGGIFTSDDKVFTAAPGEATWSSDWNKNRRDSLVQSIAWNGVDPQVLAGLQDNGVVLTDITQKTATQVGGGDGFQGAIGAGGQYMLMSHNGYIFNSADAGKTWGLAENGLPQTHQPFDARVRAVPGDATGKTFVTVRQLDPNPDGSQGNGGVFKTTDGGLTFAATPNKVTRLDGTVVDGFPGTIRNVDVHRTNPNVMGAVTDEGFVYTTADGGATWQELARAAGPGTALPTEAINSLEFDPKDPSGKTLYIASGTGWGQYTEIPGVRPSYLYKMADGGKSWTPITGSVKAPLPNVQVNEARIDPTDSNHILAATAMGLYRTFDGGANWQPYNMPKVDTTGVVISADGKTMVAGTYGRDYFTGPA